MQTYSELKQKGLATIQRIGGQIILVRKKFDANTGDELSPEIRPVERESLEKELSVAQRQLESITELIADVDALE